MRLFFLWALVCLGFAFAGASAVAEHKPVSAKSSSVSKTAPEAPQAEQQPNIDSGCAGDADQIYNHGFAACQSDGQLFGAARSRYAPVSRAPRPGAPHSSLLKSAQPRINLSPVLMLTPNLKQAELTAQNQLRLTGYFPSQPLQIRYELVFLMIGGVWRIEDISVDAVPPQPVADASRAQTADSSGVQTAQAESTAVKSSKLPAKPKN